MPVTLTPTGGAVVEVSAGVPATFDEAGYNALTWTAVGGFDDLGEIGPGYEDQSFDSVTDGRIPYRGILDGGSANVNMADAPADAGQVLMKAAFDAAKGSAAEVLAVRYKDQAGNYTASQALVSTWRRNYGGAQDIIRRAASLRFIPGTDAEGSDP